MSDTKVATEPSKVSLDSVPPPAHPEAMPEKMDTSSAEGTEELEQKQTNKSDIPEPEYPSFAKVLPVMLSIYGSFFLIALVSAIPPPPTLFQD